MVFKEMCTHSNPGYQCVCILILTIHQGDSALFEGGFICIKGWGLLS